MMRGTLAALIVAPLAAGVAARREPTLREVRQRLAERLPPKPQCTGTDDFAGCAAVIEWAAASFRIYEAEIFA